MTPAEIRELVERSLELANDERYDIQNVVRANLREIARQASELLARVEGMEEALRECSDDLEAELEYRYGNEPDGSCHPALKSKFDRDMAPVVKARAALAPHSTSR